MLNTKKTPVLFTGHGSPMNAIGQNRARDGWEQLSKTLEKPRAIAAVSAHWQTEGLCVRTAGDNPQINDMYGFPDELYRVRYAPAGDPVLADKVLSLLGPDARADNRWGIDHGVWTVLCNLFPAGDVPVVMIGVDPDMDPEAQYEAGRKLAGLRDEGVMLLASGNTVYNLRLVDWNRDDGFDWAERFNGSLRESILAGRHEDVVRYRRLPDSRLAVPTTEHFLPLLTALGAVSDGDRVTVFNDFCELGSMAMTSYLFS